MHTYMLPSITVLATGCCPWLYRIHSSLPLLVSLFLSVRGKSQALISYDLCHCYSCQLEAVRKEPRSSCANANMPVLPRTRHLDGSLGISQHVLFFLCNQTAVRVWKYIVQRQ